MMNHLLLPPVHVLSCHLPCHSLTRILILHRLQILTRPWIQHKNRLQNPLQNPHQTVTLIHNPHLPSSINLSCMQVQAILLLVFPGKP